MHPGLLMFIAARHVESRVQEAVLGQGYDDITLAQARLTARIPEDGIRLTELAESAQVTKQTAGALVDQLERTGYVTRIPDPTDARARLVVLAERARAVQRIARKVERQVEREWEAHLGTERMKALQQALEDLREITDPYV